MQDSHKLCTINSSTKIPDAWDGSGEHEKSRKDEMWVYTNLHLSRLQKLQQNTMRLTGITQVSAWPWRQHSGADLSL